jgi:hypothetical protein
MINSPVLLKKYALNEHLFPKNTWFSKAATNHKEGLFDEK